MRKLLSIIGTPAMANAQYQKGKVKLDFSKSKIKKAGDNIRKNIDIAESIEIIQNYRAAHLYPLMIIKNHIFKHVKKITSTAVIARRLKRLPTIIDKLQRATLDGETQNSIALTRMQDIGGCRVIFDNKEQLIAVNASLDSSRTVHETKKTLDYNNNPKLSGYRGIHRVYKCYEKKDNHDWKGFSIEVQLRTKLQHLWATTVEVVDLCENQSLKTDPFNADKNWIAFFKAMSDFISDEEGFISLSNLEKNKLKERLISLNNVLNATKKLSSVNRIFSDESLLEKNKKKRYAVIAMKHNDPVVYYLFFSKEQERTAIETYSSLEGNDNYSNALFVEMDDIRQLKVAYPNYLIDTRQFIEKFKTYTTSNYWVNPNLNRKVSL